MSAHVQRFVVRVVRPAVLDAHRLGLSVTEMIGDAAYRRVQAS